MVEAVAWSEAVTAGCAGSLLQAALPPDRRGGPVRNEWGARVTSIGEATRPAEVVDVAQHLTNVLKMVAFQAEGALVELVEPHYARHDDEGRTLIQTALRSAAAIEPTADELRVTLAPLSSPHRSEAIRALCAELNLTNTLFPGTKQRLRFAVAEAPLR